ncbi:tetratricopeptide repeat domain-containing protein [Colletotrichum truncatum]|uniref:Tetratricopeptide repeat domain-containing protein n=1 Tax=Colletotrichum truncatum TaxID=5467 RepID=A0ACC3Z071_COLTU
MVSSPGGKWKTRALLFSQNCAVSPKMKPTGGFIFMGCPHSSSRDLEDWFGVESILQKFTKGRKNALDPQCVKSLAADCDNFRVILAEDEKRVLTVSEKKGMSKQVIGKKIIFVDKDSATIGLKYETVIEDNSNHRDLCLMSGSNETLDKALEFLYPVLKDTRTAIAKESPQSEFDAVFWVAADEETKLFNSFREIALKLGIITATDGKDLPAIRETLLAWLANPLKSYEHMDHVKPERASWLIIFDNVERADTLEDFWPKDAAGSVLVTCRDPLVKRSIYLRNTGIIVPELSLDEGVTLLLRLTSRDSDQYDIKQAPEVVRTLGRYPLAIAQMAGVILARDLSFDEFLELYSEKSERKEMLGISEGQSASLRRYNQTLGTVWALDDLKEGKALLEVISFLDPDKIPESLLEKNPACTDWYRYPKTALEYSKARAELLSRSLIYRNRDKKTLRVHRLVQDTVRTEMDDATYNEVYSRVLDMLGARWPRVFKGFGNVQTDWQKNAELWPHTLSLFKYRDRFNPAAAPHAAAIKRMDFTLDILMFSIADSRFSASPVLITFFSFLRDAVKEDEPSLELQMIDATFHYRRGELGLHINDREHPLPDFSKCVELLDMLLDDDAKRSDSFYGVTVNELGCAYLMNWDDENGLVEFEKATAILKNLKKPSAQETTMAQINEGFVHGYLGRYEEASQIFDMALKDRYRELGEDDASSFVNGKLFLGWGNILAAQGRLDESFRLHIKCLEHYKRSVGNLHHRTGDGCVKASDHFARTGDGPTALALLDQALKIFDLDSYHRPEAARAHYKKGNILKKTDREAEAKKELDMALDIFNSVVPPEDRVGSIDELDDEDFDHWIMFWSR